MGTAHRARHAVPHCQLCDVGRALRAWTPCRAWGSNRAGYLGAFGLRWLSMLPLTPAQLAEFESAGAVIADVPLAPPELDAAEAAWDELSRQGKEYSARPDAEGGWHGGNPMSAVAYTAPVFDETFLRFIGHEWFEAVAKQVLRSDKVFVFECGPHERAPAEPVAAGDQPPGPAQQWRSGMHLDVQLTSRDWAATPRREMLAIWVSADAFSILPLPAIDVVVTRC
eukprot:SAG22_NODE_403_length_11012_cov_12.141024_15_plen_225_part_00